MRSLRTVSQVLAGETCPSDPRQFRADSGGGFAGGRFTLHMSSSFHPGNQPRTSAPANRAESPIGSPSSRRCRHALSRACSGNTTGGEYAPREVAAICERLDHLPLAIELAAVHVKTLSLSSLYERLTHRLALLRGGARDLPARQQTMEDGNAWSYELLTWTRQQCFRTLGIFVGGWTLEAAEAVCWAEEEKASREIILSL